MDFWTIIERDSTKPFNVEAIAAKLESSLKKMPDSDVLEFCNEFDKKMNESYTWGLWGVAYLINGGCSDDSFMDFRSSLIASGRTVFETVISDPESLIALDKDHLLALFEEGFLYCGSSAYESLTGRQPERVVSPLESPTGQEWEETASSLRTGFPKVWEIYGWSEEPEEISPPIKKPWWKLW